eukprot:TRINITY_DN2479_c0_g1_i2.p1 TRINITY_DN2479_c0_g1~~TRINITY_DN2479_c0_g1_i2.p1  ORF type:complete len:271 (+),score=72.12 TRINITY_DN2479_c0_g1_i2:45-857(+)
MDQLYLLPTSDSKLGRSFPSHGFAGRNAVIAKKYGEVTSATAITFNLLLPFLNGFNTRLEAHVKDGSDLSAEELRNHVQDCSLEAAKSFSIVTAKIGIQTSIAAYLIEAKTPAADATVYLWDSYPRLHQKYVGDLCEKLYIPRFLASLLGPKSQDADIACFDSKVPFANAFEDSLKRHVIITIADVTVSNVVVTLEAARYPKYKHNRPVAVAKRMVRLSASKVIALVGRACGGATGNLFAGGVGEYWGEYVGAVIGSVLGAKLVIAVHNS